MVRPGTGNSYQTASSNVWLGVDVRATTTSVALSSTLNGYVEFTDVQLESGVTPTALERRPDTQEQLLTARYYELGQFNYSEYGVAGGTFLKHANATVQKRAIPTITRSAESTSNLTTLTTVGTTCGLQATA